MASRGRRPAGSGTRAAIAEAARVQFAELGYRRASLRSIATAAGVDPRLVLHYFGSKQGLFAESVDLPVAPQLIVEQLFAGGPEEVGQRAAELLVSVLDDPARRNALTALLRAAVSEPDAAVAVRDALTTRLLLPIAERLGGTNPELRASLVAALVVGIATGRHIVGLAALTGASREELVRALAPVVDHYLRGDWAAPIAAP